MGVVYLLGVLVISTLWGLWPGLATAVASTFAYNYFHLPPFEQWTLPDSQQWVTMTVFLPTALLTGYVGNLARSRAIQAEEHRRTAVLAADLAHLLLRAENLNSALPAAAQCLAQSFDLPNAAIRSGVVTDDEDCVALPLRDDATQIATLLVPAGLPEPTLVLLRQQVVPSLQALLSAAVDRETVGVALQASFTERARVAEEQAALRRIATLVACGAHPSEVFDAVTGEMSRILGNRNIDMQRFEPDGTMTLVSHWDDHGGREGFLPIGSRWPIADGVVTSQVWRTGEPARADPYKGDTEIIERALEWGVESVVGCPIMVENRVWGVIIAFSRDNQPPPEAIDERMVKFTELLGTAIANAQSRAELKASRARIIAAADEARRRIERDLHDGAQQRLVALGLELRAAEAIATPALKARLSHTVDGLTSAVEDLQELSRGLHPAILSRGGLCPTLKMLARRSSVPVELNVCKVRQLPEAIETAVYFIVSEALTNVTKHAQASVVDVSLTADDAVVRLAIRDDGVGGADTDHGSGLIGLKDRVAVLGGEMEITSPLGSGTSLLITIPTDVV